MPYPIEAPLAQHMLDALLARATAGTNTHLAALRRLLVVPLSRVKSEQAFALFKQLLKHPRSESRRCAEQALVVKLEVSQALTQ